MFDRIFFKKIKTEFKKTEAGRRKIQKNSGEALHLSKRAIFAFHRRDLKDGRSLLKKAAENLAAAEKGRKDSFKFDGSYKAALEEYSEAELFRQFLSKETIGKISGVKIDTESYLGGLADLAGEILRYAVRQATERDVAEVRRARTAVDQIIAELTELNLTGYLRTKFDQAKQARRKLEQIVYELSLSKI